MKIVPMNDVGIVMVDFGCGEFIKLTTYGWEELKEYVVRQFLKKHPSVLKILFEESKGCQTIDELLENEEK